MEILEGTMLDGEGGENRDEDIGIGDIGGRAGMGCCVGGSGQQIKGASLQ